METERNANWGLLAVVGLAIFGGMIYGVVEAGPPPSLRFAVAEALLLVSVLVMIADLIAKTVKTR